MMQLMQMNSSQAQSLEQQPLEKNRESAKDVSKEAAEFAAMVQGAQAQALAPVTAEKSQETRQVAASMNTAALSAGQQPWSKNWVFQGGDQNPALNPLIGDALGSDPEALKSHLEAAQNNAPRSLVDLLSSDSPEVEKLGMEMLGRELQLKLAQSPEMAAELAQLSEMGEWDGAQALDSLSLSQQGEFAVDTLSQDHTERRGLEAGKGASRKPGMNSFAQRPDANASAPKLVARPQLVSGADFLTMKQGAHLNAKAGVEAEGTERFRDENLGNLLSNSSDSAGLSVMQSSPRSLANQSGAAIPLKLEVNGNVIPGAGMKERLTSESVVGMSQSLMRLGAQGGGEIRLKLKPDALGEVRIGVISHGNSVSLQIHAMDEKAKRIVEESLGSLKDALAGHSLQLAKVDLQVAPPVLASNPQMGTEQDQGQRHAGQGAFGSFEGQRDSRGQSNNGQSRERLGLAIARAQAFAPSRAVGDGRLDVRA